MKTVMQFGIAGILLSLSVVAHALDVNIAVIDTDRILRESAPAVRAGQKLEREFEPRNKALIKLSDQIRLLNKQLEGKLSESNRRHNERELIRLNQEFQRMQLEFNEDMARRRNEEVSKLNATVTAAIKALAEKEKIDLVLQEAVYRSKRIDITDEALKYLADK